MIHAKFGLMENGLVDIKLFLPNLLLMTLILVVVYFLLDAFAVLGFVLVLTGCDYFTGIWCPLSSYHPRWSIVDVHLDYTDFRLRRA